LGAAIALFIAAWFLLPGNPTVAPVVTQADHAGGGSYTTVTLLAWGVLGALFLWSYVSEAERFPILALGTETLLALVPLLAAAPLFHVLLLAGLFSPPFSVALAEPVIYATTLGVVFLLGAVGGWRGAERGRDAAIAVGGVVLLLAALALAWPRRGPEAVDALALVLAASVAGFAIWGGIRLIPLPELSEAAVPAGAAVLFAHALDGLTTWVGVRDPFGWHLGGFAEENPVSGALLGVGNGWPFLVAKIALPIILLVAVRDLPNVLHRRIAFLAVFVLGFGPGASNAIQMALR
jgi:uncharacterized membrane protein